MPKLGSSPNGTANMKRKASTNGPSSVARTSKRPRRNGLRPAALASGLGMNGGTKLELCSYCTGYLTAEPGIYWTNNHFEYIFENMSNKSCACCELIWNAMPVNVLSDVTGKDEPSVYIFKYSDDSLNIPDREAWRLYGTLVGLPFKIAFIQMVYHDVARRL
jgi:hypothetical protein